MPDARPQRFRKVLPPGRRERERLTREAYAASNRGFGAKTAEEARPHYEQAAALYRRAGKKVGEGASLEDLGGLDVAAGNYDAARARFVAAIRLYRRDGYRAREANARRALGDVERRAGNPAAARRQLTKAIRLNRRLRRPAHEIGCLHDLGRVEFDAGDYDAARSHFKQAVAVAKGYGDQAEESRALKMLARFEGDRALQLGVRESAVHRHGQAREWYVSALREFRKADDLQGQGSSLRLLASTSLHEGRLKAARNQLQQAITTFRRSDHLEGLARCRYDLGQVELSAGNIGTARIQYNLSLAVYRKTGSELGQAMCRQGLGHLALTEGDTASARALFNQALPGFRRANSPVGLANCLSGLGDIELRAGKLKGARDRFDQAEQLYLKGRRRLEAAHCNRRLGDVELRAGNLDRATTQYQRAYRHLLEAGDEVAVADCQRGLGEVALRQGNHADARTRFEGALSGYQAAGDLRNQAVTHAWLARATTDAQERDTHRHAFEQLADRISEPSFTDELRSVADQRQPPGAEGRRSSRGGGSPRALLSRAERRLAARQFDRLASESEWAPQATNIVHKAKFKDGKNGVYKPISGEFNAMRRSIPDGGMACREVAASRVDEDLRFGLVPPTGFWDGPHGPGSLQVLIEGARSHQALWRYSVTERERMAVFDYIIGNTDRSWFNYITGPDGRLIAIDHGCAFPENSTDHAIRSSFVAEFYRKQLSDDVRQLLGAVDLGRMRQRLRASGLSERAVDGALDRLAELRTRGQITGEAWGGKIGDARWNTVPESNR